MKITRRQLRRIIKEATPRVGFPDTVGTVTGMYGETERRLSDRLLDVWNEVSADTLDALGGTATWEEIADEVLAAAPFDLVDEINLLPFNQQEDLFKNTFGAGRRR
jgi:hypothetical protein